MQHTQLSEQQKRRYIEEGGIRCPYCRGLLLDPGNLEVDGAHAWCHVTCLDCREEWFDHYTLTAIGEKGGKP